MSPVLAYAILHDLSQYHMLAQIAYDGAKKGACHQAFAGYRSKEGGV